MKSATTLSWLIFGIALLPYIFGAKKQTTKAPGKINAKDVNEDWRLVCGSDSTPVQGIRVSMIEVGQTIDWHLIETKITDDRGRVSLATKPYKNPKLNVDFILRISYSYEPAVDEGDETPFSISHENETVNEDNALTEELLLDEDVRRSGIVKLTEMPCLAFVNMKRALDDFRQATGRRGHPGGALKMLFSQHIADTLKRPFSSLDTIVMPIGYRMNYSSALHELARTLRYSLDGSYSHFLRDMTKYVYTQPHFCTKKTNPGFAFNEGWAYYWADETSCFIHDKQKDDYSIEGSVAAALKDLSVRCHGKKDHRKKFYDLLDEHPLEIHTYKEFLQLHTKKYNCGLK